MRWWVRRVWVDAANCSRAATRPPHRPYVISLIAAKSLAQLDLSLRDGGCGKQNLG
jgi:hypothetical protein